MELYWEVPECIEWEEYHFFSNFMPYEDPFSHSKFQKTWEFSLVNPSGLQVNEFFIVHNLCCVEASWVWPADAATPHAGADPACASIPASP